MKKYHLLSSLAAIMLICIAAAAVQPSDADRQKAEYIFLEAADAYDAGRYDDYYFLLRRAASLNPADPFIAAKQAEMEMMMKGLDSVAVEKIYDAIAARHRAMPSDDHYAKMFATLAQRSGKIDDVIEVWATLDSLKPRQSEPAANLSQAYLQKYAATLDTTYYNRSLSLLNRLERGLGPTVPLSYRKVSAYLMRNDTAAILREINTLNAAAPADVPAALFIGNVYEHLDMPDSALTFYNRAATLEPENGSVYLTRAEFFRNQGDSIAYDREVFQALESQELEFDQKFELLTGYVQKLYTDTLQWPRIDEMFTLMQETNPGEAQLHDFYASYLDVIDRKELAAEQLSYSIDLDPTDARRWNDLVSLYYQIEQPDKALETSVKALHMFPELGVFQLGAAIGYIQADRKEEALEVLADIDTLEIANTKLLSNLFSTRGDILNTLDRADEAQSSYKRAVDLDPENYMAMNNWAYHNAVRGIDLDTAELYASIAAAAEPESPTVLDTYAWVLFKKKEYDKARVEIDRVLDLLGILPGQEGEPKHDEEEDSAYKVSSDVLDHAGDIYFWTHEPAQAVIFWKKALELEPDNKIIKKKAENGSYYFE